MESLLAVIAGLVALVLGLVLGYLYQKQLSRSSERQFAHHVREELEEVATQQQAQIKDAIRTARETRANADRDVHERRQVLRQENQRLQERGEALDARTEKLDEDDRDFLKRNEQREEREHELDLRETRIEESRQQQITALEAVATMTRNEAKEQLLASIERETRTLSDQKVRQITAEAEEKAEVKGLRSE